MIFLGTAYDLARNLTWLWSFLAFLAVACLLISAAANGLVGLLAWIDRRNERWDAEAAADFGEPSRAEIEQQWAADEWADIWAAFGYDEGRSA